MVEQTITNMHLTCTRRIQFCAGHRVMGHEGKCRNMHGHNYIAHITAEGSQDSIGRVIDFSVLKERIGSWIDQHWDHGFIVYSGDDPVKFSLALMPDQKVYELPYNPTAENIALYVLNFVAPLRLEGTGVRVTKVVIEETENCSAEAAA